LVDCVPKKSAFRAALVPTGHVVVRVVRERSQCLDASLVVGHSLIREGRVKARLWRSPGSSWPNPVRGTPADIDK
jgi:hypothetical protein